MFAYDLKLAQRLWNLTAQLVGQSAAPRPTPSAIRSRFLSGNPAFS